MGRYISVECSADIDISDYMDKIPLELLTKEIQRRKSNGRNDVDYAYSKHPIRDSVIDVLGLPASSTIEDIQDKIKDIYYK